MYNESAFDNAAIADKQAVAAYMSKVYGWMSFGLLVTAICAFTVGTTPHLAKLFLGNQILFFGLIILELLMVLGISFLINKMSAATAGALFILYSAVNGLTLSVIFIVYQMGMIGMAFGITAGTFATMSVYGFVTKRDLTTIGNLCFMGLIGIIIASIVNMFIGNGMMDLIIAYITVLVFVGLTAYDTQKIKETFYATSGSYEMAGKAAVLGALALYLDFINLFLAILRILGGKRD